MNILVVCQYYKPEPFRISDICEALVEAGHTVTVVTGTPNYPEGVVYPGYEKGQRGEELLDGVRVHRCPIHPRKTGALHRFWNYYSFAFASRRYLSTLKDDFDVVLVNQLSPVMMAEGAICWAKRRNRRVVLYCLDLWPESLAAGGIRPGSLIYRLFLHISRRIYRGVDEILLSSRGFASYFQETLGIKADKLRHLPQYAEALFDEVAAQPAHSAPYHFVFAGNIGELQSVETLVAAAALLKEDERIRFHIIGDGTRLDVCKALAADLPHVTFHGRQDLEQMPRYYAMADGLLVTLKGEATLSQTLPGKVQSYLAAGRAVVGAVNGETALVIADGQCGRCVAAGDSAALAEQLRQLASQPELLVQYGDNGRRYYHAHFRKEAFLANLIGRLEANCPHNK